MLHAVPSALGAAAGQVPVPVLQVAITWHSSGVGHTTAVPLVQVPAWQVSLVVHMLPSLQLVPLAASGLVHAPVVGSQTPATWQASSAVQTTVVPAVQTPAMHDDPQPAPQAVPSGLFGLVQAPVDGLQTASWQASAPVHATGLAPVQTPAWQVSVCVHRLPSLQAVPFAATGSEQAPVDGSQVPAVWHWSEAGQATGLPPVQTPAWQESVCVHRLPSLQAVPFATAGLVQAPVDGSQVPAVWH
jgi:hypothetical protein